MYVSLAQETISVKLRELRLARMCEGGRFAVWEGDMFINLNWLIHLLWGIYTQRYTTSFISILQRWNTMMRYHYI